MKNFLPKIFKNKNAIWFFVVITFFVFIAISGLKNEKNSDVLQKKISQVNKEQINKDSDGDGLKDWEEVLRGLDPQNPDSNGNGISDSDEIKRQNFLSKTVYQKKTNKIELAFIKDNPDLSVQEKRALQTVEKSINEVSQAQKSPKKPIVFEVSPKKGAVGTPVILRGFNFTKTGNTVYAGYTIFRDIPSLDGVTLSVPINPKFPVKFKGWDFPIEYWFYVENKNGLSSDKVKFNLVF